MKYSTRAAYEAIPGSRIEDAVRELLGLIGPHERVALIFNDVVVKLTSDTIVEDAVADYEAQLNAAPR